MTAEQPPPVPGDRAGGQASGRASGQAPGEGAVRPDVERWTALLGKWMEFARASVAFPKDAEGDRMRAAVGPLITLHATICALGELETLPRSERALAVDVAGVQIGQQERILRGLWSGAGGEGQARGLPGGVLALIDEARQAHRAAEALLANKS